MNNWKLKKLTFSLLGFVFLLIGSMFMLGSIYESGATSLSAPTVYLSPPDIGPDTGEEGDTSKNPLGHAFGPSLFGIGIFFLSKTRERKKGQAAMEFLMTYGWAILAAIISVTVLAFFGVFSPEGLVNSIAIVSPPLQVNSWAVIDNQEPPDTITIELINGGGDLIAISNVSFSNIEIGGATYTCTGEQLSLSSGCNSLNQGRICIATISCNAPMTTGDILKADITITFAKPGSNLQQVSTGSIVSRVIEGSGGGGQMCGDFTCDPGEGEDTCNCEVDCGVFCGDSCVGTGEVCDPPGSNQTCIINGYNGNETCLAGCLSFGACTSTEFCGDGIVNGNEQCDLGNQNGVPGSGCDSSCQLEGAPTEGLVGYWSFEGDTNDQSGNKNHGTINGDPQYVIGITGQALDFDAVGDWISITSDPSLNPLQDMTISVWIKTAVPDTGNGENHIIIANQPSQYVLSILSAGNLEFTDFEIGGINVDVGNYGYIWHHIVTTVNGTTGEIFFDGVSKATGILDRDSSTAGTLFIGSLGGGVWLFNGTIDEIRIYNRSLSASEVLDLYNQDIQFCGDGIVNGLEECDDGTTDPDDDTIWTENPNDDDGVCVIDFEFPSNSCLDKVCGDGYLDAATEQCDDGNLINGDECDEFCQNEGGAPTGGLVGYWSFDGDTNDQSGNGNNGAIFGNVDCTVPGSGISNQACSFDGVNGHIAVPYDNSLNITKNLTVSAWVYGVGFSSPYDWIIGINENAGYGFFANFFNSTTARFRTSAGGGYDPYVILSNALVINKWIHLVMTTESVSATTITIRIYIDGSMVDSATANNMEADSQDLIFGRRGAGGCCVWNGSIDEMRIYNRTLSDSEIQSLFDNP